MFVVYWNLPPTLRRLFLLAASCYFYMALLPKYIVILVAVITIDYFLALQIDVCQGRKRKLFLIISILTNIGILFFFKYFNFFSTNIETLAKALHFNYNPIVLNFVLPLGLSFHVFQSLSYVIEVYKRNYKPERNYITYALYVMFFPQLVAGPIERPTGLLPQLSMHYTFDYLKVRQGLERMLWGFFKKLVIADQIAQIIDPLFLNLPSNSTTLIAIAVLFTYQIYCDFSGYTDIALGVASMLGFTLRENFNRPFAAKTFSDFWHRWHMSLSTWFRDYVYFPLGGSRVSKVKAIRNVSVVFLLSGFWHGANWTFIVWGMLNGLYLIVETETQRVRGYISNILENSKLSILYSILQTVVVFGCVAIAFVFFRATDIEQAWWILQHIIFPSQKGGVDLPLLSAMTKNIGNVSFVVTVASIFLLEIIQYLQARKNTLYIFESRGVFVRYIWYICLTWLIILFGYFDSQTFIYFQF